LEESLADYVQKWIFLFRVEAMGGNRDARTPLMIETLKTILLDFQDLSLGTGVPRRLKVETIPGKATVCIGFRRSGKSTYLFQIVERLMNGGVPRENILYLNFFDDRLHGLQQG
jgi:hypothetical protein